MTTHPTLVEECCVCGAASDLRGEAGEPICAPCWDDVQDAREFYAARDVGYQRGASAASDMEAAAPFDAADAARRLGVLVMMCMDCQRRYDTRDAQGADGGISHGLCVGCANKRADRERRIEWAELTGGETE